MELRQRIRVGPCPGAQAGLADPRHGWVVASRHQRLRTDYAAVIVEGATGIDQLGITHARYLNVVVEMLVSERTSNLVEEGIDLCPRSAGVRLGRSYQPK